MESCSIHKAVVKVSQGNILSLHTTSDPVRALAKEAPCVQEECLCGNISSTRSFHSLLSPVAPALSEHSLWWFLEQVSGLNICSGGRLTSTFLSSGCHILLQNEKNLIQRNFLFLFLFFLTSRDPETAPPIPLKCRLTLIVYHKHPP